jgi:outer membrane protein assembly factor BamA
LIITSCNPTKYVPEGETLLDKNTIVVNNDGVKKTDLEPYIRQKPNKRIFGSRFYLGLYNLSNIEKEKWPHSWLRNIGEEPSIFDISATLRSKDQIKSYVASKGFFDGKVTDTIETKDRRSEVTYNVELSSPYTIRSLFYEIADSNIEKFCYFDSVNCLIERGHPYDVDILQAEQKRFERYIKERGFYGFSGDHIVFRVDSTIGKRQVDIHYVVRNASRVDNLNRVTSTPHAIFAVKDIYIYTDYVPKEALERGDEYLSTVDTIKYNGYYFITSKQKQEIKYDLILQALYLKPGELYNLTNAEQSRSHLLSLKVYRLVNINYVEIEDGEEKEVSPVMLNCNIQLTLFTQQSYKVELEGTNSQGYFGGAVNLIYQHKNLFHGAELFSMKIKGAYEALRPDSGKLQSIQEYGIETSLNIPKFLLPVVKTDGFIKKYNPSTTFLAAYNYQAMPWYTRTIATGTFGYKWKAGRYQEHIVNPLQFNLVKVPRIDSIYNAGLSVLQLKSYEDVMIIGGGYSFIFNNQQIQKKRDSWFLRINAETAGNMTSLVGRLSGANRTDGTYTILGLPFAQFVRSDIDLRYNYKLNDASSVAYRAFVGVGMPYGNSTAMPFEKQYFGGGANGIRAWQARTLGPGSYISNTSLRNQTSDIKIEANAEYRFKLFWILEGALFVDAGNIWSFKPDDEQEGSQFRLSGFYNDIAVGTGTGFRFDLKFVIARIDFGMKLRDPTITNGSKWIVFNRPYSFKPNEITKLRDFTAVLGIGYPF